MCRAIGPGHVAGTRRRARSVPLTVQVECWASLEQPGPATAAVKTHRCCCCCSAGAGLLIQRFTSAVATAVQQSSSNLLIFSTASLLPDTLQWALGVHSEVEWCALPQATSEPQALGKHRWLRQGTPLDILPQGSAPPIAVADASLLWPCAAHQHRWHAVPWARGLSLHCATNGCQASQPLAEASSLPGKIHTACSEWCAMRTPPVIPKRSATGEHWQRHVLSQHLQCLPSIQPGAPSLSPAL